MQGQTALPALTMRVPSAPGAPEVHNNRRAHVANLGQANRFGRRDRQYYRWPAFGSQNLEWGHGGDRHLVSPVRTIEANDRGWNDQSRHAMQVGAATNLFVEGGMFNAFHRTRRQTSQAVHIVKERAARLTVSPLPVPAKPVGNPNIIKERTGVAIHD